MVKRAWQVGCVAAVAIFLCGLPARAGMFSEQAKKLVEERAYCGIFGTAIGIDDDGQFNGTHFVTTADPSISGSVDMVPRFKSFYGGGGLVGYRKGEYAMELSYWRSEHLVEMEPDPLLPIYESRATYHSINVDIKRYIFPRIPLQPFFMMGVSLPWLVVQDSSTPSPGVFPLIVGDTSYSGLGYNLGVGLEFYATKRISINGAAIQRWAGFNHLKGYFREDETVMNGSNENFNLKADNLNFTAGVMIDVL